MCSSFLFSIFYYYLIYVDLTLFYNAENVTELNRGSSSVFFIFSRFVFFDNEEQIKNNGESFTRLNRVFYHIYVLCSSCSSFIRV